MELIKKSEFDLSENKAKEIANLYMPMVAMLENIEDKFNEIVNKPVTKELTKEAKRLRLDIAKIRTTADKARKTAKDEYLRAGNAIQGAYNTLKYAVVSKEEKLAEIEKHYENLEKERIDNLEKERLELVIPYVEFPPSNLGHMEFDVFDNYLAGLKAQYQAKIDAEAKAEKERIEKEKQNKLQANRLNELRPYWNFLTEKEQSLNLGILENKEFTDLLFSVKEKKQVYEKEQLEIKKENDRLKAEAEAKETKRLAEEKERQKIEAEKEKLQKEKEAQIKKLADEKLLKEKQAKEKIEKELKLQKEKEEKRLSDIKKAKQLELSKGDDAKFKDLLADLESLKTKYVFESIDKKKKYEQTGKLINKIIIHITK